jgi:cysteine desulfurase
VAAVPIDAELGSQTMLTGSNDTIYLDHAATTPCDPEVVAEMLPYFSERFGNPSSVYSLGQEARAALDQARVRLAAVLGCEPAELIVTSGATESDNLALAGVAWASRLRSAAAKPPHLVTTAIEHSAVLETARWLEQLGFALTVVPCDGQGLVRVEDVEAALRPETCLVSVMLANNEVGSIQPVAQVAELTRARGIPLHTDAVQAAGSLPIGVRELGVDLLSLAAHKCYGPKGIGLLYVRRGTPLAYLQRGGEQEGGRRGGTENVPLVVGMAAALTKADRLRSTYVEHCSRLRDRLVAGLHRQIPDLEVNGPEDLARRLPNNANLFFPGVQGETVLLSLDMEGVAASAGSACTAGKAEPSHVLEAMGLPAERTRGSVRFTVGRTNTEDQVDEAIEIVAGAVLQLRELGAAV